MTVYLSHTTNHDIVCFSHDWGGDPLSKNHLMRLAARDCRVLWVNSIGYRAPQATVQDAGRVLNKLKALSRQRLKQVEPNLWTLSPLVIPAYGAGALRWLNQQSLAWQVRGALKQLGMQRPINWVFNPAAALVAGHLDERLIVYYCVDDYLEIEGVNRAAMGVLEDSLVQQADVVIASAETLCESKTRAGRRPVLIRHGVQYEHFRRAAVESEPVAAELAALPRPVIGYFGLMSRDWFDVDLMHAVAQRFSEGSVVLLGKSTMDLGSLAAAANVHILGQKPFERLPEYCRGFDAAVLPFPVTELTRNANPLKVREYLAAGLPVVSTRIPEVEAAGGCFIADTTEEFLALLDKTLADDTSREVRSATMECESWEARYEEAAQLIADALAQKESTG